MARCSKDLPSELVDGIFSLLDDETDILRSCSVCCLWRDSAVRRARSLPAGHQVLHSDGMEFHLYKHSINLVGDPVKAVGLSRSRTDITFRDVIVHKGELLGVDIAGRVVIVDKDDNDGEELLIVAATGSPRLLGKKYLVQSIDGELLLVENYQRTNLLVAGMFGFHPEGKLKVFKLNEDEKTWVEVQDLGDNVLFLGYNSAFALSSSSDLHGNARNRIFFTDNMSWPGENEIMDAFQGMYVFNFASQNVTPLTKCPSYSKLFWPPPAWLSLPAYDFDSID